MDHEQTAASGGPRGLARAALDHHRPRHHVLRHPGATVAAHADAGLLVHAGAVVTDVPLDLDLVRAVEADGDAMATTRAQHPDPPAGRVAGGQTLVELAH